MSHKRYFSYIRVSTARQGQLGTSLVEQQAAIDRYARQWNLRLVKCYEERETAAKAGRPVFLEMLKALRQGKADGVVIHKIDRSARNLKDWADLGSLMDSGIEVFFANESLDLNSRGGRLSADIQAVVASDYIRNLREETKKGIYGRLKQGLYPFPARVGYLDAGKGKPKEIDPVQAPLVRQAFELYASGDIGLNDLVEKMYGFGLRNKGNKKVTRNGLATILHNKFYTGLVEVKASGELFAGQHQAIISKSLFDKVQLVLAGKNNKKKVRHFFVFRRQVSCALCRRRLIPERRKIYVYYRCQTGGCRQQALREELIESGFLKVLEKLAFTAEENRWFWKEAEEYHRKQNSNLENTQKQLFLQRETVKIRLGKLADAYVDEVFDKETYLEKKNKLIGEEAEIKERLENLATGESRVLERLKDFLGLVNRAYSSYELGMPGEKRELVKITVSDFSAEGKKLLIKLSLPFQMVAERNSFSAGSPYRATSRTKSDVFTPLVKQLYEYFREYNSTELDSASYQSPSSA